MADNNKNKDRQGRNPGNKTGHGSGQQTAGKRGEKQEKEDKAGYHRSSGEKGQRGRHGGNR